MTSIADSWKRIIDWYAANTPAGSLNLSKGASKKAIGEVETAIGMPLPEDLKESYRLHNGNPDLGGVFSYGKYLLTLDEVATQWKFWSKAVKKGVFKDMEDLVSPDGPIKKTWWNTKWIPVTGTGGGDFGCVDMDPAAGGNIGQVIFFFHETGPSRVDAPSWAMYLSQFAHGLEHGAFEYDERNGGVVPMKSSRGHTKKSR